MNTIFRKFSHELRNPLTSLSSTVQLLEMRNPELKELKYWSNLQSDIDYMIRLLEQFSDLGKAEKLSVSTFSFYELLEQISLSFAAMTLHSDVQYTCKIDSSITQITGDKTKIQEVIWNLLKNAYDATFPDKSIYFEATKKENFYLLTVKDTGCGISKERLTTIFEPFVTYKPGGTGLGLAICRQVIDSHGGELHVESEPGKGTTFFVTLPADLPLL